MEKKLAKLERRTQEAVHILIRQFYHSVLRMIFLTEGSFQDNGLLLRRAIQMIWWARWRLKSVRMQRKFFRTRKKTRNGRYDSVFFRQLDLYTDFNYLLFNV